VEYEKIVRMVKVRRMMKIAMIVRSFDGDLKRE
jgi:hypothetical protein